MIMVRSLDDLLDSHDEEWDEEWLQLGAIASEGAPLAGS